jgi:hypothetical protein
MALLVADEQYSSKLALEIPGKDYVPIKERIVQKYDLKVGIGSPYLGYRVVARKPEWELKPCPHCNLICLSLQPIVPALFVERAFDQASHFPSTQGIDWREEEPEE